MPVGRKGFLFNHFEKIICGIVGVIFLVAVVYGIQRMSGGKVERMTGEIGRLTSRLEQQMKASPPELDLTNYVQKWRAARSIRSPGEVQEIFWYPWPIYYHERRLAANQEYELQFREPLAQQSVKVEKEVPSGEVVESIIHPVGVDYSKVKILTGDVDQGEALLSGTVGKRAHRMPIVVDADIRERAEPPVNVSAEAVKDGIIIRWERNADNTGTIELDAYEVFRKKASEVTGRFTKMTEVKAKDVESRGEEEPESDRSGDRVSSPEKASYQWKDPMLQTGTDGEETEGGVRSGETYRYKVRSIAQNSEPPTSEFSPVVRATALPTVDYQFTGQSGNTIRFKVRVYQNGRVEEEGCAVSVGEEIGVYLDDADGWQNFLTGCYLLDFQPGAFRRDPFAEGRVIVVNRQGQIEARWEEETEVEYLWNVEPGEAVDESEDERPRRPSDGGGSTRIVEPE